MTLGDPLKTFNAPHNPSLRDHQRSSSTVSHTLMVQKIHDLPIPRGEARFQRCAGRNVGKCAQAVGVVAVVVSVGGCRGADSSGGGKPTNDKPTSTTGREAQTQPAAVEEEPPPPPPPATLAEAVGRFRPNMQDTRNKVDSAAVALGGAWLKQEYPWVQLQALPTTTFGKIKKDSDSERGKRICASGVIVQISAVGRSMPGAYEGILMSDSLDAVSFLSVGSTGELVQKQGARFCGVVTGTYSYSNSGGGTTHAVNVVGMFDLPENKKPTSAAAGATARTRPSSL